ncbi:MAG: TonB-dependent receptor plug domain-containing protein [Paludibacter sp.]|nr:TonB-dependent receptor plug domain-containing protein [Bacteroidales bacterium]MCM1069167.1 TonB-dependent receptor plug domain-containing protein [Prevotella sp.]MCM1354072.1 TonB-dependent receptor plug domain-containing protein [Bacteroides sp.]MCM1442955.1 TonB-dependent receptor plug domain-containing protein [Muribaculum sp.]MCM1481722.1 TonB-dependent receptor plug domain-containing protein [Paludibacter sp.]
MRGRLWIIVVCLFLSGGCWADNESIVLTDTAGNPISLLLELDEVVVTAVESHGAASSSVVNKEAMQHLQPSSFTDILSMLPGSTTKDPNLNTANTIHLREAGDGTSDADYQTTSLGTGFVIDGVPISTDANMQYIQGSSSSQDATRQTVNAGVDMRTISTDDIEKVEVIRGIAGAEYGDITSGVVKIERTMKPTPWKARFKADGFSKLFYVGKGVGWRDNATVLNVGIDYLNAKSDPTNSLENYQRTTLSARLQNRWQSDNLNIRWQTNVDYTGSIDNDKIDPDINYNKEDAYRSQYHHIGWGNTLNILPKDQQWWTAAVTTNLSGSFDRIEQTKLVQLSTPIQPVIDRLEEGEWTASLLPYRYVAAHVVDGRPFNAFVRPKVNFVFDTWHISHKAAVGVEWKLDKNFGDGQVYDMTRPLNYNSTLRPRAYSDIPANNTISWYVQDELHIPVVTTSFDVEIGVRGTSLMGLDAAYAMRGKHYVDPRVNISYHIPVPGGEIYLAGGIGQHTKMPTLLQLYPNMLYEDLRSPDMHVSPTDSTISLYTHLINPTNYNLQPARNLKWEARVGIDIHKHNLSITYFEERMNDGFRTWTNCIAYTYPITQEGVTNTYTKLLTYPITTNGSAVFKQGVEWQYASPRIPAIYTRFTVNGAWLRTTYQNSQSMFSTDKLTAVVGNTAVKDLYVGLYDWTDGSVRENFNTNLIADVHVPKLGLTVSATIEFNWYSATRTLQKNGTPIAYMDTSGELQPYTETDRQDPYLQWLVFQYNADMFRRRVVPFAGYLNFRVQKSVTRYATVAFFVNKLLDFLPDYEVDGVTIHRTASPYFGMEINLTI